MEQWQVKCPSCGKYMPYTWAAINFDGPEGQGGTYLWHLRQAARRMAHALVEETPYLPFTASV